MNEYKVSIAGQTNDDTKVDEIYQILSKKELTCLKKHVHFAIIVTANEEWDALIAKIKPVTGYSRIFLHKFSNDLVSGAVYFGILGKQIVAFTQCSQGGASASSATIGLLALVKPKAIIAVGMLGGLNKKDHLGTTVIISTQTVLCGHYAIKDGKWIVRGSVPATNPRLLEPFRDFVRDNHTDAEFASIASADQLARSGLQHEEIQRLLSSYPEARGVEMEAHGIYSVLARSKYDASHCLIVKAISDYCSKALPKYKKQACESAVDLCFGVFNRSTAFHALQVPELSPKILTAIRGCIGSSNECIVIPSPDSMRRPTRFYTGRNNEDSLLKASLLDTEKKLTILLGPRGTGKSEILRHSLLKTKGSRSIPWVQQYFDVVIIVDFAYTRVKQGWIEYVADNAKGVTAEPVIDFIRRRLFSELFAWTRKNAFRQILLVFENCEELEQASGDPIESIRQANNKDFTDFINAFLESETKNIKVMLLTAKQSVIANLERLGDRSDVDIYPIQPLARETAYALLANWEQQREATGYAKDDTRIRDCIYQNGRVDSQFRDMVALTGYLPRMLKTLNGIMAVDASKVAGRKNITEIYTQLKDLTLSGGDLNAFLDSIYSRLNAQRRSILLFMASIRLAVSPHEIRNALKSLSLFTEAHAFDGRTVPVDLAELERFNLVGKLSSHNKWELPNQILDFVTNTMLEVLPSTEKEAYYQSALEVLDVRCEAFEAEGINASSEDIEAGSGFVQEYRYESDEYRTDVAERIRCYGFVSDSEARIITLKEFLAMMSWWGETEDFKTMNYILDAWTLSHAHQSEPEFHRLLKRFYESYVKDPDRDGDTDWSTNWRQVLKSLEDLEPILENDINSLSGVVQRRLQGRINYARSGLSIYMADAISSLERDEVGYVRATTLYEKGIEYLHRVERNNFDIAYNRVTLFYHHAHHHNWEAACKALLPVCDYNTGRDVNDREVEAKILNAFSFYFFQRGDFENGLLAGLYSCLQSYIFLFTQSFLADSYSIIIYQWLAKRFYNQVHQLFSLESATKTVGTASLCHEIREFWRQNIGKVNSSNDTQIVTDLFLKPVQDFIASEDSAILPNKIIESLSDMIFLPLPLHEYFGKENFHLKIFKTAVGEIDQNIDDYIARCGEIMTKLENDSDKLGVIRL